MDNRGSNCFDIFDVYSKYCDIVSGRDYMNTKEQLSMLSKSVDDRRKARDTIFSDIFKLMSFLDASEDSRQFNCFYEFVFFICRENGQKNITVHRAVAAWRIVLHGRFRLLDQWCNFIQKHQRHNISEDTWQQLLAFSQCVNEDLEGYNPKGAWPVLIDDFVEHMYRMRDGICCCAETEAQWSISNTFSGLNLLPGSKRKNPPEEELEMEEFSDENSNLTLQTIQQSKRPKQKNLCHEENNNNNNNNNNNMHTLRGCVQHTLSNNGFEGYLSIGSPFQFDPKNRASLT